MPVLSGVLGGVQCADRGTTPGAATRAVHPPGLLAYVDGVAAGWCAFGPRTEMERLKRSRTIQKVDDTHVWSIVCFVVRAGYRRRGIARTLLDGVVSYAHDHDIAVLKSYPVDTAGARISGTFAYVGTTQMFEDAGFHRVEQTRAHSGGLVRWIMRREFRT
ncbi:MAG: GNAT family N-acetyltransferase [Pseudonocardiaceae bacterium]